MNKEAISYQARRKRLREKLRERFRRIGLKNFNDAEALGLLLTYGIQRRSVKPVVRDLLEKYNDFRGVLDAPVEELAAFPGLDEYSATLVKLAKASAEYYLRERLIVLHDIGVSALELVKYLRAAMSGLKDEQFRVIYLNNHNKIIAIETVGEGTVDQHVVYPRKVMERALYHKAISLIFAHNHPAGSPKPSQSDKAVTRTLVEAAKALDIEVQDHLIIGKSDFFSFRDAGLI